MLLVVGALAAIAWAYWPTIVEMGERWVEDPQYSHGFLVPVFSGYLLWSHRKGILGKSLVGSWWAIAFLAAGFALWGLGTHFFFNWFCEVSMLIALAGLAVAIGGWTALRWSWQAILFLGFMVPIPYRLQTVMGGRLQQIATSMSTYAIQTLGAPAIREGNVILINDVKIGVVEACNGLGMLMTFFAISTAMVMLLPSLAKWIRAVLLFSAIPVAIFANVVRITATGLLMNASQMRAAHVVFHDIAGLLMMPLAIVILFVEIRFLKMLLVELPVGGKSAKDFLNPLGVASSAPSV